MGSTLQLTIAGDGVDRSTAGSAWRAVSDEFDAVDAAMSRFRADSAVTRLNGMIGSVESFTPVEPRLYYGIAAAERARRSTGGRFDACVLVHLDHLGHTGASLPDTARRPTDRPRDCWVARQPRARAVSLLQPIDLGGIGKGLALRWSAQRLMDQMPAGTDIGFLLDAGGDLVAGGPSPDGGPWSIGIEDPFGAQDPVAVTNLSAGSLCTSSIRLGRWRADDGREAHHIIDPASGESAHTGLVAVTVAGPDPAWSEVWSKALFLAGESRIANEARQRGMAVWWIDEVGQLSMTPAARAVTTWP